MKASTKNKHRTTSRQVSKNVFMFDHGCASVRETLKQNRSEDCAQLIWLEASKMFTSESRIVLPPYLGCIDSISVNRVCLDAISEILHIIQLLMISHRSHSRCLPLFSCLCYSDVSARAMWSSWTALLAGQSLAPIRNAAGDRCDLLIRCRLINDGKGTL